MTLKMLIVNIKKQGTKLQVICVTRGINDGLILQKKTTLKKLWNGIDWKCKLSKQVSERPQVEELATYFENLYKMEDRNELSKIKKLETITHIPELDDPMTQVEMDTAVKNMKKGGYDFTLTALHVIMNILSPLIFLILNMLFYTYHIQSV